MACAGCVDAVDLDQIAMVELPDAAAEVGVLACDEHLRRIVLALEVLDAVEQTERFVIPPLVDAAFRARLIVEPERRQP